METPTAILLLIALCVNTSSCIPDGTEEPDAPAADSSASVSDPITLLTNGMAEADVYRLAGEPKGTAVNGSHKLLIYDGAQISIKNGVVADLPDNFTDIYAAEMNRIKTRRQQDSPSAGGPWQWVKKNIIARDYVIKNQNGEPVRHRSLIHPGKVTVIDFYADWCVPCKRLAPHLDSLMKQYPDAVLKKVNIHNWGSETCNRYAVSSVPNVRVFDRYGHLVAEPTSDLRTIEKYIRKAMKR